ncbi:DUF4491 family protein [Oceanispirochaeta crateris]|uniref:DUF4491 family protein n=1 Tax=Oceanispirochaeta crateris TaxID=2518645 RepID=A0A5C1QGJ5_9SPIO|nr:DUF4491 family protein [Oceanispirochaeta crateris]QEN07233.1 DUF4491 family protein [Oceanispirochaeta crateris]
MYIDGLAIGFLAFMIIGVLHPVVIKGEYFFGVKIWPLFLVLGLLSCGLAVILNIETLRSGFGILGFSLLWSIGELFHQKQRVEKGWFPMNPKRKSEYNVTKDGIQ